MSIQNGVKNSNFMQGNSKLNSEREKDSPLQALLNMAIQKESMHSQEAEKCLEVHKENRDKLKYCLIAWSLGSEKSEKIQTFLKNNAFSEPGYLVAALRWGHIFDNLDLTTIKKYSVILKSYPNWMLVLFLKQWLRSLDKIDPEYLDFISSQFIESEDFTKYEVMEKVSFFNRYMNQLLPTYLSNYCDTELNGSIKMRCWRFLSVASEAGLDLTSKWAVFLPDSENEVIWKIFQDSFPLDSKKLNQFIH